MLRTKSIGAIWIVLLLACLQPIGAAAADSADELVGLWKAERWFGPFARGPLVIHKEGVAYSADMGGRIMPLQLDKGELTFELPNNAGGFRGKIEPNGDILGHWYTPPLSALLAGFRYVSPVRLKAQSRNRWTGEVVPFDDKFTFYLLMQKRPDGSISAFLQNPDRGYGAEVVRLSRDGDIVKLFAKRAEQEREFVSGNYDGENKVITLTFPGRGGSYDFKREGEDSDFYPRGKNPSRYVYQAPLARDDGWPTGTLEEANIDRAAMERFIQMLIDIPMDSVDAPQIHGVLIARHGKLVLEEYFHGEHRDRLHETRSAAKTLTAVVAGAAMQADAPLKLSSPVYQVMNGGTFPPDLESQKRAITFDHLLNMASGFFCDDTNPEAPGNENTMMDQTKEPDYYRFYMQAPLDRIPGEKAVYCSADPNLALGMVGRATGENPMYAFDRLVGGPMKITRYGWAQDPAGNPYGGGSVQFLPRDFMKLGQLMLNDGTWNGHRILSREFVKLASTPQYHLRGVYYSYLRWGIDYPYKDRTVQAMFAGGAGSQAVMTIPALDLVVAIYAGNYHGIPQTAASAPRKITRRDVQQNLVPRYILPAVREAGDDKNSPVILREDYTSPYGSSPNGSRASQKN